MSFAVGYAMTNYSKDIEKILNEADVNMYNDKRKFYKYQTHLFTRREGLMAYAGVSRWEDIADKVRIISAAEAIKRGHIK